MSTKLGHHVFGIAGNIKDRKGYICHVAGAFVWLRLESGWIVTDVPLGAFVGRRGRPATVHSIVARVRVKYDGGESVPLTEPGASPTPELWGTFVGEAPDSSGSVEPAAIAGIDFSEILAEKEFAPAVGQPFTVTEVEPETFITVDPPAEVAVQHLIEEPADPQPAVIEQVEEPEEESAQPPALKHFGHVKPPIKMVGEDGNAWAIIARAREAAKQAGWTREEIVAFTEEAKSDDYDHLLRTVCHNFEVVDDHDGDDGFGDDEDD